MIDTKELEKFIPTYSIDRVESFIYSEDDSVNDVIQRYQDNLRISQAFYPELATLEVILRNAINSTFCLHLSETWLEDEINNNTLLDENDYNMLITAYNTTKKECLSSSKDFTIGRVIANLNFGFWTNLCAKKYSIKIWNRMTCFKRVFVNYPNTKPEIAVISKKLYMIRKLRNRIFHYEQIFRYPQKTLQLYNTILEMISYLPQDEFKVLNSTSTFLATYDNLLKSYNNK